MGSLASKMMEDVDFTGKNGHWWLIHLIHQTLSCTD